MATFKTYDKLSTEYHEAVHGVLAYHYRIPIERISITQGNAECVLEGYAKNDREREQLIVFLLAPWVYAEYDPAGCNYDFRRINKLLTKFDPDRVNLIWVHCVRETVHLVLFDQEIEKRIEVLANVLLERETLTGSEVYEILDAIPDDDDPKQRPLIESLIVKEIRDRKNRTLVTTLDF